MVELVIAERCIMKKNSMHKIITHSGHGHNLKNRHHGRVNVCGGPAGHPSGLVSADAFLVFCQRHHRHCHRHKHIGLIPRGEEHDHPDHHHGNKHQSKGHGHGLGHGAFGHGLGIEALLKHHRTGHRHDHRQIPFGHASGHEVGLKHHRTGHKHGHRHGPFGHGSGPQAGIKYHGRRLHHGRCVKFEVVFQHEGGEGSVADGREEQTDTQVAPGTPTIPQAEAMMENLSLATTGNEANHQP